MKGTSDLKSAETGIQNFEVSPKESKFKKGFKSVGKRWQYYILLLPMVVYFIIFKYGPMYGLQIAFKDYTPITGFSASPWVGFEHFKDFFDSFYFWRLIRNTILISLYDLALFPISIIVALSFNELRDGRFKKITQTITYAPHFISLAVMVGMLISFLDPDTGIINYALKGLGFEPIDFMQSAGWFKSIFVWSNHWQQLGWGAIIYLAALASVDPQLIDAAKVDGATRLQRIRHINIPAIMPTIVILLILQLGNSMNLGFQKIILMQNSLNMESSSVIQTYVFENGILQGRYSFAAAIGLFDSLINFGLLIFFNRLARRTGTSLW